VLTQTGEVDISGFTLTLSGTDVLESFVNGPGTLALGGQATLANFTDRATVIVTGAVTQTGTAQFGSLPLDQAASTDQIAVTIAAGGSYNLAADVNVNNTNTALDGLATFTNAGLLEKTAAGGISKLFVDVVSSGTILATAGNELDIESIATSALNGTITGAGTLFLGRDLFTIDTTVLNIATLDVAATDTTLRENLAYGGVLNQTARIDIAAFTFTLTGTDNLDSLINGTGTLVLAGVANLANFTDTATVTVTGTANQNAVTQFGTASGATVQVGIVAGGIYDLASDTNIDTSATNGLATFTNAGLLEKTAATGTSTLFVNVVNNATILAASGNLAFADTVAGTGTLDIAANSRLTLAAGSTNGVLFEGAGAVLAVASGMQVTGPLNGLALGDTIDVQGLANAPVSFIVGTGNVGTLLVGTNVFTVDGGYGGLFFDATTDGNGGTDVVVSTVPGGAAGGTPPAASGNPPGLGGLSTAAQITAAVSALIPAGTTPNVVSVAGGGYGGAVVAGTLNAYVATTSGAGAVVSVPAGFGAGYLLAGTATLQDATGGVVLVDTAAGGAVTGMAADTLFGGDGGDMLTATSGAETLIGGTGSNSFFLGASSAFVESQGSDIITGSSAAETVNASGSALYFGTSGATTFNASGTGGDTIIGGGAGNTVQGGGGAQLIFGSTTLNYTGGAGAATIIGGGGGNSVTGGSGNELIFASSSLTFNGTGGAATIIGGGGPMIVNLGAGGGLVYGSPGGNDTLASGSGTAIMVGGGGGDVLVASGAANDTLVAGGGAETLSGAGSTGNLVLFGGPGDDTLAGGSGGNLFIAESGNETLVGGGSSDSYVFVATPGTTRTDVIVGFNPNVDAIGLFGYGGEPGADQAALASATVTGGNTVLSLSDGTSIVLVGTPALQSYNFF
jgi:Ca2+-binding RTX toxin-like protein